MLITILCVMVKFVLNELKRTLYILLQNDVSVQNVRTFTIYVISTTLSAEDDLKHENNLLL